MQGQQEQALTFQQKVNILQYLTLFPALTVMVFLRRKIGYRFLDMLKIQVTVLLLWVYGAFSAIAFGPAAGGMVYVFSLAVLIAAIIERRIRWNEIRRGISWHTYSRGISWFSGLLPLSESAAKRFADPAAALVAGIALFFFLSRPLGFYLILSAACLFVFETIDFQKQIDRMLDQLDSLIESEVVSENIEYFEQGGAAGTRPIEETAGIPTGTDPDLAAAIERKRRRAGKQTPTSSVQGQAIPAQAATPPPPAASSSVQQQTGGFSPVQGSNSIQAGGLPYPLGYPQQHQAASEPPPSAKRRRASLPDNLIIPDSSRPTPSQPAAPLQAAPLQAQAIQQQEIPVINSPADPAFAALPSGAEFMTPDGKKRVKK